MAAPQEATPDASSVLPGDLPAANTEPSPLGEASPPDAAESAPAHEVAEDAPSEAIAQPPAAGPAAVAAPARPSRFALLAASVALAAALGSAVGSLSASGLAHLWSAGAAAKSAALAEANALQAMKAEVAELSALKASLDSASRSANGQFAKITDRLDRVERAQIEPAIKLAHLAEAVDRLEKKNLTVSASSSAAAPETTGALGKQPAAPGEAKLPDKVLQNWVVQNVRRGHALIENRYGAAYEVTAGNVVPGLGLVESIKRQDGQWVVVTARGLITEH